MTYPTIMPAITLDFANSRQLDPRITFSRSSSATYLNPDTGLITTASEHEARFEEKGLLMEESRTNMITYSEDLDNTSWNQFNTDVTNSVMDSPKGSSSVSLVQNTGANTPLVSAQYLVFTVGSTYTLSAFVKKGNNRWVRLAHVSAFVNGCWFDLDNGVTGTVNSEGATMTAYTNGWYRITNTFVATTAGPYTNVGGVPQLAFLSLSNGDGNVQTSIGQNIYVWGYQLEAGSFPTSYIPTSGSTVTRAAETCQLTGINFYPYINQDAFTIRFNSGPVENNARLLGWGDGGTNLGQIAPTTFPWVNNFNQAGSQSINLTTARDTDGSLLQATAYAENNFAGQSRGRRKLGYGPSTTSGPCPVLNLGTTQGIKFCGFTSDGQNNTTKVHIKSLAIYPERLTDAELQTLTS